VPRVPQPATAPLQQLLAVLGLPPPAQPADPSLVTRQIAKPALIALPIARPIRSDRHIGRSGISSILSPSVAATTGFY
jgi:hypothetical protein